MAEKNKSLYNRLKKYYQNIFEFDTDLVEEEPRFYGSTTGGDRGEE